MKKIMIRLALLAEQSGEKVSEVRLEYTAEKLFPLGCADVCAALEKLLDSSRRFPTIEEIKTAMGISDPAPLTVRDIGTQIANLLIEAMGKYGTLNSARQTEAIKIAVGPAAWEIAAKLGGWDLCCERAGENPMAFVAQARDLAEAYRSTIKSADLPSALPSLSAALDLADGLRLVEVEAGRDLKSLGERVSFSDLANRIVEGVNEA